jgi:glycine oxidase
MLAVTLPPGVLLRSTLRSPEIYLVPRGEGRVIIGATVEDAGFDTQVDAAAMEDLLRRAAALWPPIAGSRITDAWAGLRPATPDGLPILDRLSDQSSDRIFIAAGHFRNGILLAPGTARLMAAMVLGHRPEIDPAPYRARRFGVQDQATTAAMTTV